MSRGFDGFPEIIKKSSRIPAAAGSTFREERPKFRFDLYAGSEMIPAFFTTTVFLWYNTLLIDKDRYACPCSSLVAFQNTSKGGRL